MKILGPIGAQKTFLTGKKMLTEDAKDAWKWLFIGQAMLVKRIDLAMQEAGVIGLETYDVLLTIEMQPHQKIKMCQLAERVLLSRSGVTRLADRLEKLGWIERVGCERDGRSTYIRLTEAGLKERERAWPVFKSQIELLFATQLKPTQISQVGHIFRELVLKMEPTFGEACREKA